MEYHGLWFEKTKTPAEEAEARVVILACQTASKQNGLRVAVESDCQVPVKAVLGLISSPWRILDYVEDIKGFVW